MKTLKTIKLFKSIILALLFLSIPSNSQEKINDFDTILLIRPISITNDLASHDKSSFKSKVLVLDILRDFNNKFRSGDTLFLNYDDSHFRGVYLNEIYSIKNDYLILLNYKDNINYNIKQFRYFKAFPIGLYNVELLDLESQEKVKIYLDENEYYLNFIEEYKGVLDEYFPSEIIVKGNKFEWYNRDLDTNDIYKFHSIDMLKEYLKRVKK